MNALPLVDTNSKCEICGSTCISFFDATEKMYGMGGSFTYAKCHECNTIYQKEKLSDYSQYYPRNYYSFDTQYSDEKSLKQRFRKFKKLRRERFYFFKIGIIGKLLSLFRDESLIHPANYLTFRKDMRILDVGCGSGEYIHTMAEIGFKHLFGLDPFVGENKTFSSGVEIFRGDIKEFANSDRYEQTRLDLIMFHHSFEHSPEPLTELVIAKQLLAPGGKILVRIPVSGSYAAEAYGENWFQLDAPRHIYLFNEKSMKILADKAGLKVESVYFDSIASQFWGSEQYRQGISLVAENSYAKSRRRSIFNKQQLFQFRKDSKTLNRLKLGDQAGFILSSKFGQ